MSLPKTLIWIGIAFICLGLTSYGLSFFPAAGQYLQRLGRLPGDIRLNGKYGIFFFPLTTCLLLSGLLTLIFWLIRTFIK